MIQPFAFDNKVSGNQGMYRTPHWFIWGFFPKLLTFLHWTISMCLSLAAHLLSLCSSWIFLHNWCSDYSLSNIFCILITALKSDYSIWWNQNCTSSCHCYSCCYQGASLLAICDQQAQLSVLWNCINIDKTLDMFCQEVQAHIVRGTANTEQNTDELLSLSFTRE